MDLKAPFELYDEITCVKGSGKAAEQSTELVRLSGVAHQFRTTVDPFLRVEGRLERLQQMVEGWGEQLVQLLCQKFFVNEYSSLRNHQCRSIPFSSRVSGRGAILLLPQ